MDWPTKSAEPPMLMRCCKSPAPAAAPDAALQTGAHGSAAGGPLPAALLHCQSAARGWAPQRRLQTALLPAAAAGRPQPPMSCWQLLLAAAPVLPPNQVPSLAAAGPAAGRHQAARLSLCLLRMVLHAAPHPPPPLKSRAAAPESLAARHAWARHAWGLQAARVVRPAAAG